jgi:CheY-like chemotaxis protein
MHTRPSIPSRAMTVLIAEDDRDLRVLITRTLRFDGYAVVEASNGDEALAHLADAKYGHMPDVLLADIRMPGLSGFGLLEAIRRAHIHLPVILMTAIKDKSIRDVAERMGSVGLLQKPFDFDDLLTAVLNAEQVMSSSRIRHLR